MFTNLFDPEFVYLTEVSNTILTRILVSIKLGIARLALNHPGTGKRSKKE